MFSVPLLDLRRFNELDEDMRPIVSIPFDVLSSKRISVCSVVALLIRYPLTGAS